MNIYSIDTSALIDGIQRYYRPIVHKSLWLRMDDLIQSGRLIATEEVRIEIERKEDRLKEWCKERTSMFIEVDHEIQPIVSEILFSQGKLIKALSTRSSADPFVIALAKQKAGIVVTGERPSGSLDRPKIPDVCRTMNIRCMNLMDLMEEEEWRF
jgi:hypothetical protein